MKITASYFCFWTKLMLHFFLFLWNMIIIVVDCQYTLTSSISLLIAYILSTPSFSAGPSLNTAAWFCIACTTTKIHSLDDHHHSCYFHTCTFKSHNFIGLCFKMSVVPEPLNANSTVNYKYYTIIVKIVIHWWYGLKWYICWFYTFCILCLISAVVWLPLAWRSLSMLATDSSPAFCPKKTTQDMKNKNTIIFFPFSTRPPICSFHQKQTTNKRIIFVKDDKNCYSTGLILPMVSPGLHSAVMVLAQALPKTTRSSRELAPSLLAPCTEAQAASPQAYRPGTTRSWPFTYSITCQHHTSTQ